MSFTEFLPLLSLAAVLALAAVVPCAVLLLRWLMGPANAVSRRWSLWTLRGAIMLVVLVVLANPVRVDKLPGPVERPEMFYLLDTSASMRLGSPESRWQQSLALIDQTRRLVPQSPVLPKAFRFGQRLAAIGDLSRLEAALDPSGENQAERHRGRSPQSGATNSASDAWGGLPGSPVQDDLGRSSHDSSAAAARDRPMGPLMPTDADTRLVAALRQISSRFGRVPPLGVVVLSDGRAHDEADLDQLAAEFARLKVPIHVAPIGDTTKGGDIAVAAVVAPPRARKFTEIEVQVFLRSYGYDGKRAEVQLLEVGDGNRADRQLAPPLPITLQSGFQSVSLSFRTELSTRKLRVAVPPLADEVSSHNNQIETEMAIDRTKLRVLYIEGSPQPFSMAQVGGQYQVRGPFTDFKQALTE
ncbi:MAG TPA: hypothetical protein VFW87_25200, partial [Pirellulales bacterium]|nr:hypothetical protein [Pirellulales bacterium]